MFLREKRFLCNRIQRIKNKGTGVRKPSSPETEPNFYSMPFLPQSSSRVDQSNSRTLLWKSDGHPSVIMDPAVTLSPSTGDWNAQATNCCLEEEEMFNPQTNIIVPSPLLNLSSVDQQQPSPLVHDNVTEVTEGNAVSSGESWPHMINNHETPRGLSAGSEHAAMGGITMCKATACQVSTGTNGLSQIARQDDSKRGPLPYMPIDESIAPRPLPPTLNGIFMKPSPIPPVNDADAGHSDIPGAPESSNSASVTNTDVSWVEQGYKGMKMGLLDEALDLLYVDSMTQPIIPTTNMQQSISSTRFLCTTGAIAATTSSIITQLKAPAVTSLLDTSRDTVDGTLMSNLPEMAVHNRYQDTISAEPDMLDLFPL